jgi:hypothetical protein
MHQRYVLLPVLSFVSRLRSLRINEVFKFLLKEELDVTNDITQQLILGINSGHM